MKKSKSSLEHPYALSKYLGECSVLNWNKVYKLPVNCIKFLMRMDLELEQQEHMELL